MNRFYSIGTALLLAFFLVLGTAYAEEGSDSNTQPQQTQQPGGWYCPWGGGYGGGYHGGYGMGPGMMGGGYGYGMGPGMMGGGYGYGMGPGMMGGYGGGPGTGYPQGYGGQQPYYGQQSGKPLNKEQVKDLVENYVKRTGNPNLKVGNIKKESGKDYYVATITTKDGSLVDKIQINEYTGWFRSEYGG